MYEETVRNQNNKYVDPEFFKIYFCMFMLES